MFLCMVKVVDEEDACVGGGVVGSPPTLRGVEEAIAHAIVLNTHRDHLLTQFAKSVEEANRAVGFQHGVIALLRFRENDSVGVFEVLRPVPEVQAGIEQPNREEDDLRIVHQPRYMGPGQMIWAWGRSRFNSL